MANEGVWPKYEGDIFWASEANLINTSVCGILRNSLAQEKNGFRSFKIADYDTHNLFYGATQQTHLMNNYYVDGFIDSNLISSSTNWSTKQGYYLTSTNASELISKTWTFPSTISFATAYVDYSVFQTYDEFNDGSVDANLWYTAVTGTSTITESGSLITLTAGDYGSSAAGTATLTSKNALLDATHRYFVLNVISHSGGAWKISLSDNSAEIDVLENSEQEEPATGELGLYEFFYNPDAKVVYVYRKGYFYTKVDVSSLSYVGLRVFCNKPATTWGVLTLDYVRYEKPSPSSTLATLISANNGTNYTAITREQSTAIDNTGAQFRIKNVATISGNEYIFIRGYGIFVR